MNRPINKFYFFVILCFVILAKAAIAQEENIQCTFSATLVGDHPLREVFFMSAAGGETEIMIYPARVTKSYAYNGTTPIVFYKKNNGDEEPTLIGTFDLKPGVSSWMLLFVQQADGGYRIAGYPMPVMSRSNSVSCSFINISRAPVVGIIGKQKFSLSPGEMKSIDLSDDASNESSSQIMLALRNKDTWTKFYSTYWGVRDNQRWTVLIYPKEDASGLRVLKIREVF